MELADDFFGWMHGGKSFAEGLAAMVPCQKANTGGHGHVKRARAIAIPHPVMGHGKFPFKRWAVPGPADVQRLRQMRSSRSDQSDIGDWQTCGRSNTTPWPTASRPAEVVNPVSR